MPGLAVSPSSPRPSSAPSSPLPCPNKKAPDLFVAVNKMVRGKTHECTKLHGTSCGPGLTTVYPETCFRSSAVCIRRERSSSGRSRPNEVRYVLPRLASGSSSQASTRPSRFVSNRTRRPSAVGTIPAPPPAEGPAATDAPGCRGPEKPSRNRPRDRDFCAVGTGPVGVCSV